MIDTSKKMMYKAFGLTIWSELVLPELPQMSLEENQADLCIEIADLSVIWSIFASEKSNVVIKRNFVMFNVQHLGIFSIHEGKKIFISPLNCPVEDKVRFFVLETCLGVLLLQRKILFSEESAVAIDAKALRL